MKNRLAMEFVAAIREVVGTTASIGLHIPEIGDVERQFVDECLASTFVSSVGPFVGRFENEIAEFTGAGHAIAVSNGTSALQVALVLAGVERGDEVIVPTLSFVATANAVVHAGGTPYFIDSDLDTLGIAPGALSIALDNMVVVDGRLTNPKTGNRIGAIVPMHAFGHPADIESIMLLADRHGIPVVEDAAESLGSFSGGKHTGTFGTLGVLSFNGNKIVTTGGGGMILTDDDELGRRAKHLTTTAKLPSEWGFDHDEVAWNFRMPNLNAALGVAQLTRLGDFVVEKRRLAQRYADIFASIDGITFIAEPDGTWSNYWLSSVRIDDPDPKLRDELLRAANDDGLQCRPLWNLLHGLRMYAECQHGNLETATRLQNSVISMPSSPHLGR